MYLAIGEEDRIQLFLSTPIPDTAMLAGWRREELDDEEFYSRYYQNIRDDIREFVFRNGTIFHEPTEEQEAAWEALNAGPDNAMLEARLQEMEDALVELAALIGGGK